MVVVTDLADPDSTRRNRAVVSAGVAADPLAIEPIVDLTFTSALIQQLAQARHAFIVPP